MNTVLQMIAYSAKMFNKDKMKIHLILLLALVIFDATTVFGQPLKDTIVDIDGNVYHTVKVGTQIWMVENLKVTHYRNGDTIPNVTDSTQWRSITTGAYCNYNNDTNIARIYGRLYNRYVINDIRGIAPKGWHVPNDSEYRQLTDFMGCKTYSDINELMSDNQIAKEKGFSTTLL